MAPTTTSNLDFLVYAETRSSMPIVPFTEEQEAALRCLPFLRLVRCLGLDPPLIPVRIFPTYTSLLGC